MANFARLQAINCDFAATAKGWSADMQKATRKAIAEASKLLVKQTKSNLSAKMSAAGYNYKPMQKAVKSRKIRKESYSYTGGAHIMGGRTKGSKEFALKFFETGTAVRSAKGHNRGRIKELFFFKTAIAQTESAISRIFQTQIDKVNK